MSFWAASSLTVPLIWAILRISELLTSIRAILWLHIWAILWMSWLSGVYLSYSVTLCVLLQLCELFSECLSYDESTYKIQKHHDVHPVQLPGTLTTPPAQDFSQYQFFRNVREQTKLRHRNRVGFIWSRCKSRLAPGPQYSTVTVGSLKSAVMHIWAVFFLKWLSIGGTFNLADN